MKCVKCNNNMQETMLFTSSVFTCTVCETMKPFDNALSEAPKDELVKGVKYPTSPTPKISFASANEYLTKAEAVVALQQGHRVREYFNIADICTNSYEITLFDDLNDSFHAEKGCKPKALQHTVCLGFKIINKGEKDAR